MKLSDYVINWLVTIGCRNVFGVTGGSVVHLLHSAENHPSLTVTYNHHEQASSFSAEAASRIHHNNPSACMVTTGPGGTNAITGLASAWLDSIPTVFISGQARLADTQALKSFRQSGSQHLNIVKVVESLCNYSATVESEEHLYSVLREAARSLYHPRPGPVWIDIPLDLQWYELSGISSTVLVNNSTVADVIPKTTLQIDLQSCKRPLFLLGYGCRLSGSHKRIVDLLHRKNLPYVLTWNTLDFAANSSSQNLGLVGISGTREANLAVKSADCIIAIGSHLSKMLTGDNIHLFAKNSDVIHIIDIDNSESLRFADDSRYRYHQADIKDLTFDFLDNICATSDWIDLYTQIKKLRSYGIVEETNKRIDSFAINQYVCFDFISSVIRDDDVLVVDGGGNVLFSALQSLCLKSSNRLITGAGIGCMGSGLPEAIGACLASGKRTICFIGDGSMQFNIQELQTIVHNNLPIIIVLFNNDGHLAIKNTQDSFFDRRFGVDSTSGLSCPVYEKICFGYGIDYTKLSSSEDYYLLVDILSAIDCDPCVIEVMVPEATPLLPRGGFKKDHDGNNIRREPWDLFPDLPLDLLQTLN